MTILLVGGGTGGHIIPLLAVANRLKEQNPKLRIVAVIDKTTAFGHLLEDSKDIDKVARISAGKLRRYPNQTILQTILDVKTTLLNIRDAFRVLVGFFEAITLVGKESPTKIFIKGGFVAVPVGLAAHIKKIPFITHDSDAEPGLANRIIGRWAKAHLVGMPAALYAYPAEKTLQVGIPVGKDFQIVTAAQQAEYKQQLGLSKGAQLVLVTGGSQGATALNHIVASSLNDLLSSHSKLHIIHQTGKNQVSLPADNDRYTKVAFIPSMHVYTGAADLIVTRAGSFMAELAAQKKPAIAVPAPHLAGGHQVKNAKGLAKAKAALIIEEAAAEKKPQLLNDAVSRILSDKKYADELAKNLHQQYPSDAANKIAEAILK